MSTRTPSRPHGYPNAWAALAFLSVAQLMVILDASVMNIALPSAQQALDFDDGARQWVITAYGLTFGGLLLLGGKLGDIMGRKRILIIGLIGFALASALGGAAVNLAMLLASRALQGVFGALLAPAALALISSAFADGPSRARAFGIFSAISTAGGAIGLLLGGTLTEYADWRWALYVNIPIALIGLVGVAVFVDDARDSSARTRLDVAGALLGTAGITALVFAFSLAESSGWGSSSTIVMLVAAAVLFTSFLITQHFGRAPLLPLSVLRERNRAAGFASIGLAVISMFGMFLFLSYYFQLVKGYSPLVAGLAFLPLAIGQAAGSAIIGTRLTPLLRPRYLMVAGYSVSGAGVAMMALLTVDSPYWYIALAQLITGVGIGTAFMPAMSVATYSVEPEHMGVASALVGTAQQVGGSLGTALLNTIAASATIAFAAAHGTTEDAAQALVHGFSVAYWWAVGALALSAFVALILSNAPRPGSAPVAVALGDGAEELVSRLVE